MDTEEYLTRKKELYKALINYIEYKSNSQDDYKNLINFFESRKIHENREEFRELLHLILKISINHYQYIDFPTKIEKIILHFQDHIKQTFSNSEIFDLFKSNKRLLVFLNENKIIIIDQTILLFLHEKYPKATQNELIQTHFIQFFYPEIKSCLDEEMRNTIEAEFSKLDPQVLANFADYRKQGQNETHLCQLIRADSLDEFVIFVSKTNFSLKSRIYPSMFETNPFLVKNRETSLIEYSAFFGSVRIFEYLMNNGVELIPSLWLYAIHGQSEELIHILEEKGVQPPDNSYDKCLEEAIKCHHNEIAEYIKGNLMNEEESKKKILESDFTTNTLAYCFHYSNYEFFPTDFTHKFIFYYACKYDYLTLVKLLLKTEKVNLNETVIFNIKYSSNFKNI